MVEIIAESEQIHFVVKAEAKKFDSADDAKAAFERAAESTSEIDLSKVTKITLGGNSYGFEACSWLAGLLQ